MRKICLLFGTLLLIASCDSGKAGDNTPATTAPIVANVDSARAEIEAVDAAFMKAYPTGDSAAVAELYHSEAQVFPPNMPATDGKGMGGMSRYFAAMKVRTFVLRNSEMLPAGEYIVTSGKWTASFGDNNQKDNGKYLVLWKQEGGHWKMYRDMWSSDNEPMK